MKGANRAVPSDAVRVAVCFMFLHPLGGFTKTHSLPKQLVVITFPLLLTHEPKKSFPPPFEGFNTANCCNPLCAGAQGDIAQYRTSDAKIKSTFFMVGVPQLSI